MSSNNSNEEGNYAVKFNLLYSVYSIPNIILPFFGGTIVDKLGAHYSAFIFASLTFIGQLIFAIGVQYKNWTLMFVGRTFYGFGGESINVATSTLNSIWFQGKELALSFGINLAVSRMGSVVNNWISPAVANQFSTSVAIWVGVGMNFISVIAIGVVIYLNALGEKLCSGSGGRLGTGGVGSNSVDSLTAALLSDYRQHDASFELEGEHNHHHHDNNNNEDDGVNNIHSFENFDGESSNPMNGDDGDEDEGEKIEGENTNLEEEGILITPEEDTSQENENFEDDEGEQQQQQQRTGSLLRTYCSCVRDVRQFGVMFWLLSASCVVVYGCVLPFNNIASGLLLERNYFTDPPQDCSLSFPNECSSGSLAPDGGNPSLDINGNECSIVSTVQPLLPHSIQVDRSSSSIDGKDNWDHDTYQFDDLTSNDVDCGDQFWSEACTQDYCNAQRSATETSGKIMSIPYFLSATLSPFFGHIVDKIGHRAMIAMLASIMLVIVHLTLALSSSSPVLPLIGQGLAYTFYAAVIWPSVPLTVKSSLTGTAFGAITAVQNIGLALFPLIIASIYTASDDRYIPNVEFFFVGCAVTGAVFGVMLNAFDRRNGGILNKVQRRIVSIV